MEAGSKVVENYLRTKNRRLWLRFAFCRVICAWKGVVYRRPAPKSRGTALIDNGPLGWLGGRTQIILNAQTTSDIALQHHSIFHSAVIKSPPTKARASPQSQLFFLFPLICDVMEFKISWKWTMMQTCSQSVSILLLSVHL